MAEGLGVDQIAAGACPSCGRALTPGGRFCAHCGTPITATHDEAERRLVTVVFLDMVGSTPIAGTDRPGRVPRPGSYHYRGHFAAALEHLQEAHSVYRPDRDVAASEAYGFDVGVSALFHMAYLHWFLGRPEESLATMARAREAGEQLPMGFPLCHALVASGILHALRGEALESEHYADLAAEMAVQSEWHIMSGQAAFAKGRSLWLRGRSEEAVRVLDDALALLLQPGGFGSATLGLTWLAEALLDAGDQERAALTIARAERIAGKTEECFVEAEWRRVKARVLSAAGMHDEAMRELDLAIDVARSQGSAPLEDSVRGQVATKP